MDTVPNPVINQQIIEAAMTALRPFYLTEPGQVAPMLAFWIRRQEMTDADVAEIAERLFPKPIDRLPCPSWCTHDHTGEFPPNEIDNLVDHYHQLIRESDDAGLALDVAVHQTDVLDDGEQPGAGIYVYARDHLTPAQARLLVTAVRRGLRILGA